SARPRKAPSAEFGQSAAGGCGGTSGGTAARGFVWTTDVAQGGQPIGRTEGSRGEISPSVGARESPGGRRIRPGTTPPIPGTERAGLKKPRSYASIRRRARPFA